MAKIVSPVWSSIRGSIAGTTYLTMPTGAIIGRQRVKPTQPTSQPRTMIKDGLTFAAAHWTQLTSTQRKDWNLWATAHAAMSGRQAFCGGASFEYYASNMGFTGWPSPLTSDFAPPTLPSLPTITVAPATYTTPLGTGVAVSITNVGPSNVAILAEASAGWSLAKDFFKGPFDPTNAKGHALNAGANTILTLDDHFTAGLRYYIRIRALNVDLTAGKTGRVLSVAWIVYATAVTNP